MQMEAKQVNYEPSSFLKIDDLVITTTNRLTILQVTYLENWRISEPVNRKIANVEA